VWFSFTPNVSIPIFSLPSIEFICFNCLMHFNLHDNDQAKFQNLHLNLRSNPTSCLDYSPSAHLNKRRKTGFFPFLNEDERKRDNEEWMKKKLIFPSNIWQVKTLKSSDLNLEILLESVKCESINFVWVWFRILVKIYSTSELVWILLMQRIWRTHQLNHFGNQVLWPSRACWWKVISIRSEELLDFLS